MKAHLLPVLCAALFVSTAGTARSAVQIVPIDGFNTSPQTLNLSEQTGTETNTNSVLDSAILGGYRTLFLHVDSNPYNSTAILRAGQFGVLLLDTGPDVVANASVTWNSAGAGLGGFDLTGGGLANAFLLEIKSVDQNLQLDLLVTDTSGNTVNYSRSGLTAGKVAYGFEHYSDVNLASVNSVVLAFSGSVPGLDANIDLLGTYNIPSQNTVGTPEPSSLAALGLLCLCGGCRVWFRRRRT